MTLYITGQLDTDGNPIDWREPIEVAQFGDSLRDKNTGICWAVRDPYGDWVSPHLYRIGVKSVMLVEPGQGAIAG